MTAYAPGGRIGQMVVRGDGLHVDVAEAVTGSSNQISLTTGGATQLTLTLSDPDLDLLRTRLFDTGGQCDYADLKLACEAVAVAGGPGGPFLTVTARSIGVRKLKAITTPRVLANVSPTRFVELECLYNGLTLIAEPTPVRPQVAVQDDESRWDTIQRLAGEVGFVAFESAGRLFFGRPTWLMARAGARRWAVNGSPGPGRSAGLADVPGCRRTEDGGAEFAFSFLADDADRMRPGDVIDLAGVPTFTGRYLVTDVTVPLDDLSPVTVTAATPVDPEARPPPEPEPEPSPTPPPSGGSGSPPPSGSAGSAGTFVDVAQRQAGDTYIYGAEAGLDDPDPDAFDCSELVQWAAYQAGARDMVDGSANQLAYCQQRGTIISVTSAIDTRGALLYKPGHIAISRGDGTTIEAAGRSYGVCNLSAAGRGFTAGMRVPGLTYG